MKERTLGTLIMTVAVAGMLAIGMIAGLSATHCSPASAPLPSCESQTTIDRKVVAPVSPVVFALRVATDTCVEDRDHVYGDGTYATLDCKGDGGTIRVEVPRKEWLDMKRDGIGSTSPGPGK